MPAEVEHIRYTTGTCALPVYTHSCPWYNYYIYTYICNGYTTGMSALPDSIYQANHKFLW